MSSEIITPDKENLMVPKNKLVSIVKSTAEKPQLPAAAKKSVQGIAHMG
eukprot:CAMPEP_0176344264 /NCGR_PEP_ID=MMETSP0126-20121128/4569_1 /TAXON_ID=141414 ORGANISM="Strombidinopsis acuminatum, Strain SPMC142" /NCGR_SAMPLE_ID=MMETSP0126 /ASSEMBLY_ACC=CAM_ASM_000229 /LENGTH=48 /DNA_ID= /DNA_START= /DNA_END= /DNA_ORIENTATION=